MLFFIPIKFMMYVSINDFPNMFLESSMSVCPVLTFMLLLVSFKVASSPSWLVYPLYSSPHTFFSNLIFLCVCLLKGASHWAQFPFSKAMTQLSFLPLSGPHITYPSPQAHGDPLLLLGNYRGDDDIHFC